MSASEQLGRYVLERRIATGGMAEIWLARQDGPAGFAKDIVIKRILPHLADDDKFIEMFLDEARLAAQLSHPNIGQIFDLGEVDGSYFIAMEYIDGVDLADVVERATELGHPVPPAVAARIVAEVSMALDYAHNYTTRDGEALQLVHRDISPQNILLTRTGIPKVVDFGVAKAANRQHKTQTGAVKGKLSYMSPEQISGQPLDGRSDLFALGVVLYELVTCRRPFGHESELLAVTAILNEQPPSPRTIVDGVPEELEEVIFKALSKDAADRYASARDMQLALERVLQDAGAVLSSRDVEEYLEDLFSDAPTHRIGKIALVMPTAVSGDVSARLRGAVTMPSHPPANTRPAEQVPDTKEAKPLTRASVRGSLASASQQQVPTASAPGRGGVIAAAVVAVLCVCVLGFLLLRSGPSAQSDDVGGDEPVTELSGGSDEPSVSTAPAASNAATGAQDAEEAAAGEPGADEGTEAAASPAEPDEGTEAAEAVSPTSPEPAQAEEGSPEAAPAAEGPGEEVAETQEAAEDSASSTEPENQGTGDEASAPTVVADTVVADTVVADGAAPTDTEPGDAVAPVGTESGVEVANAAEVEAAEESDAEASEVEPETRTQPSRSYFPANRDGYIQIIGVSGGRHTVYINGRQVGRLPGSTRFEVAAGTHRVRVESADGDSFESTVRITGGATERVRVRY